MQVLPFHSCCRSNLCLPLQLLHPQARHPNLAPQSRTTLSDYPLSPPLYRSHPWVVCGLKDAITPQECPLVLYSLDHLHLSTLQPVSLPEKIVYLEDVPTLMRPGMSANMRVSSRPQEMRNSGVTLDLNSVCIS